MKTCYDFIAQANGVNRYNWWRNTTTGTRYIFGENSDTTLIGITDGTSNTLLMGEQTLELFNGVTSSWAYAGWVSVGIDPVGAWNVTFPAQGLNIWNYNNNTSALNKKPRPAGVVVQRRQPAHRRRELRVRRRVGPVHPAVDRHPEPHPCSRGWPTARSFPNF